MNSLLIILKHHKSLARCKGMYGSILLAIISNWSLVAHSQNITFTQIAQQARVNLMGRSHGMAVADFNQDGFDDIYVSKTDGSNLLFLNNGNNSFEEIGEEAGVNSGAETYMAIWGDINNDGLLDLYLGNRKSPNSMYLNNGNNTFVDVTVDTGLGNSETPNSMNMADVDADGYLDIYLTHPRTRNTLYHNNGDMTFTEITVEAGVEDVGFSMGTVFFDFDNDRDLDLYIVHDGGEANTLYQNNGSGIFKDVTSLAGVGYKGSGMGVDFGDLNNDGYMDLYITYLYENVLYLNNGDGTFTDISEEAGVQDYGMGWGTAWLDYDNDGWQDIYVVNQSYFSPNPNVLYKNRGDNTFTIVSTDNSISSPHSGFAMATSDIDNNGSIDIFVANESIADPDELFLNEQGIGNYVALKLSGTNSNKSGIGARVEVVVDGVTQTDIVSAGSGYCSQNSMTIHFGLGSAEVVDELKVYWPSGGLDIFYGINSNSVYRLVEGTDLQVENAEVITAISDLVFENELAFINYPNPFKQSTTFDVFLAKESKVTLKILDLRGRGSMTLVDERLDAGLQKVKWDVRNTPSFLSAQGMYLVMLTINNKQFSRKVIKVM